MQNMTDMNMKVQMMDAGMTLFESGQGFGNTLGQVKAEMEVYGKVLKANDMEGVKVPDSTGDFDLFMDWSTIWRVRYISCHLESAGEISSGEGSVYRYAATFKEGNRSTLLRGMVMLVLMIAFMAETVIVPGLLFTLQGLFCAALTAYIWILPSRKAQKIVFALMEKLETMKNSQL